MRCDLDADPQLSTRQAAVNGQLLDPVCVGHTQLWIAMGQLWSRTSVERGTV